MKSKKTLAKKPLAVITGASSGIGFELAKQFANNGFNLFIVAEDDGIVQAVQKLQDLGAEVTFLQANLAKFSEVEKLYREIKEGEVPVDTLVVNAGVGVGGDFATDTDLIAELNIVNLNISSAVHLTKLVLKDMVRAHRGRILFTSSVASMMPGPFLAVYAASKAFLQSFGIALRNELKDKGVSVTLLMPGATDTNFFERAGMLNTKVGQEKKDDPALVAKQGFEAFMAGKDHVVAGSFMNKVQTAIAKILPQKLTAEIQRWETEPNSAQN